VRSNGTTRLLVIATVVLLVMLMPVLAEPRPCRQLIDLYSEIISRGHRDTFITDIPTASSVCHFARDLSYLCDSQTLPSGKDGTFGATFLSSTYDFINHTRDTYWAVTASSMAYEQAQSIESFSTITDNIEALAEDRQNLTVASFEHEEVTEVLTNVDDTYEDICFVALSVFDAIVEGEPNVCRQAEVLDRVSSWARTCKSARAEEYATRHKEAVEDCTAHTTNALEKSAEGKQIIQDYAGSVSYLKMIRYAQGKSALESARRSYSVIGQHDSAQEMIYIYWDAHVEYNIAKLDFENLVQVLLISIILITGVVVLLYMRYIIIRRRQEEYSEL